ncbi:hypothetical protein ACS0TY_019151 [Phlomoides rotata]
MAKSMGGEMGVTTSSRTTMERKVRPQKEQALNCPRCHSTNTKFCYYNNYSLTQPRYFCKTCRRYWTEGGTLRNVPVGGGSRKNKRYAATPPPPPHKHLPDQNPKIHDQGHDLNLGFHDYLHHPPQFVEFPKIESRDVMHASSSANSSSCSALDFLRRGFNSFVPMAQTSMENGAVFAPGFQFQECKPLPVDDVSRYGNPNLPQQNMNGSNLMFALGAGKRSEGDQDKGQENSNGFWNGMLGGGSAW